MKGKIIVVFVLLLLLALAMDMVQQGALKEEYVERAPLGGEEVKLNLKLEAEDLLKDYDYLLSVPAELPKQEQAEIYFQKAITEIEKDFKQTQTDVQIREEYLDGVVTAEWSFQPFGIIDGSGQVVYDRVEKDGTIIHAQVELQCGGYEKIYTFSFRLIPKKLTKQEELLQEIEAYIECQTKKEGSQKMKLPSEINGTKLQWLQKKEYITPQVFFLELVAIVLLKVISNRKKKEAEKKRLAKMMEDYPDIVKQLSLLLSAGMTTRQAWDRIATQYEYKKRENLISQREVYESITRMSRCLKEGETERVAYQHFIEEIPVSCYRKLIRLLLANLEKGSTGIALALEQESQRAFEQKLLQVRKLGEEASTKMLLPLMLMLVMVMGIVVLPALMKFQI